MKRARGLTLLELLVALAAMALLAALGWRGLDGMARAQAQADARAEQARSLRAGLAQWGADLDALASQPQVRPLEWDGRVLRIVRGGLAGDDADRVRVVAWTARQGQWLRWLSPPLATRGDIASAWQRAGAWAQRPGDGERGLEVSVVPVSQWQLYYFRADSWTHPLSSDASAVPDGVRLVLDVPQGQALSGRIVRDWVSPRLAGSKS